jgi:hypothetical protein
MTQLTSRRRLRHGWIGVAVAGALAAGAGVAPLSTKRKQRPVFLEAA